MSEHPLSFFKELVENKDSLDSIRNKFFSIYPEEMIFELDREREFMRIMNPFDSESASLIRYFHVYLKELCMEGMHSSFKAVEVGVLNAGDNLKEKNFLRKIIDDIDFLISRNKERNELQKYSFIETVLESMKEWLVAKYSFKEAKPQLSQPQLSTHKMQWLGNINILTTLFYDLLNGIKSENIQPLIKATPKDIERLIVENFIDQDGNDFQMGSTIKDYLKPSKQSSKRAKGEIYIKVGKI